MGMDMASWAQAQRAWHGHGKLGMDMASWAWAWRAGHGKQGMGMARWEWAWQAWHGHGELSMGTASWPWARRAGHRHDELQTGTVSWALRLAGAELGPIIALLPAQPQLRVKLRNTSSRSTIPPCQRSQPLPPKNAGAGRAASAFQEVQHPGFYKENC